MQSKKGQGTDETCKGGLMQGMYVEDNPEQEELKVPDWDASETRRPYLAAEIVYSLFGRLLL